MHVANDLTVSTHVYQPIWSHSHSPGQRPAVSAAVVYMAAELGLQDEIREGLLGRSVEVINLSAAKLMDCRQNPRQAACAVIDVGILDADTCGLLSTLAGKDSPPVILIGRCDNPRTLVQAMRLGAFDFLPKPVEVQELVSAILSAIELDRRQAPKRLEERDLRSRIASLTPREREVLPLVVGGLLNKQAASLLGISEITLQIHRGQVMRKMQAGSLADLVRMCVKLRVRHWRPAA